MPVSTKLDFHDAHFSSRSALRAHLRRMRNRWNGRGPITGRDSEFLSALYAYHPRAEAKTPNGLAYFEVRPAPPHERRSTGKPCLWAVDRTGTANPVSMADALKAAYQQHQPSRTD